MRKFPRKPHIGLTAQPLHKLGWGFTQTLSCINDQNITVLYADKIGMRVKKRCRPFKFPT